MASALTSVDVDQYLALLGFSFTHATAPPADLALLTTLHVHQVSTVPFENLQLHYSRDHKVSVEPKDVLAKILQHGRGGYCVELNVLFGHLLRALGFNIYFGGAKVRPRTNGIPGGAFLGWVHLVDIVTFADGSRYAVDVAFGGDGPVAPLPIIDGHVSRGLGSQEVRLRRSPLPGAIAPPNLSALFWHYEFRNGADAPWNTSYAFTELEFDEADLEMSSHWASTHPRSYFGTTLVVVKFLRQPYEEHIYGKAMLVNGDVKINEGGRTRVVASCSTEEERMTQLRDVFGITLTEEQREGITHLRLTGDS